MAEDNLKTTQKEIENETNFLSNYKDKFNRSLKMLGYYIVVLISIFFIFNFTDYFSYKTVFWSNQVILNKWIIQNNTKKNSNSNLWVYINQKYERTLQKYQNFFWVKDNKISWYYCVNTEGIIKKLYNVSKIKNEIPIKDSINRNTKLNNIMINKITVDILSEIYATCWRWWNIFRVKYNNVYNWNVLTDVLSVNIGWDNKDNIYKIYHYLKNSWDIALYDKLRKTIAEYYSNLDTQIKKEEGNNTNILDKWIYSPTNILLSTNIKIYLFQNEISNIRTWFDWNDSLWFFSKLAWIDGWLYDLSVYNIKWTFKYLFDSILYTLPIVSFMYLNITGFILTWILTIFLFFVLDILPMSMLALWWYFKLENIVFYIINFFYTLIYYFIEIIVVIFIISKIIWFFVNIV